MTNKSCRIQVYLDPETNERLQALALEQTMSVSTLAKKILTNHLNGLTEGNILDPGVERRVGNVESSNVELERRINRLEDDFRRMIVDELEGSNKEGRSRPIEGRKNRRRRKEKRALDLESSKEDTLSDPESTPLTPATANFPILDPEVEHNDFNSTSQTKTPSSPKTSKDFLELEKNLEIKTQKSKKTKLVVPLANPTRVTVEVLNKNIVLEGRSRLDNFALENVLGEFLNEVYVIVANYLEGEKKVYTGENYLSLTTDLSQAKLFVSYDRAMDYCFNVRQKTQEDCMVINALQFMRGISAKQRESLLRFWGYNITYGIKK